MKNTHQLVQLVKFVVTLTNIRWPEFRNYLHSPRQYLVQLLTISLSLIVVTQLQGQCSRLGSQDYIHGNQIRTVTSTAGDMFWDRYDAQFLVPYSGENSPASIFTSSPWIGGYDQDANLHVSAQTFVNVTRFEFAPGPLINGEVSGEICANWDRHWNVYRDQILAHLLDFEDNNVIDKPIDAIYGWPGKNNPYFESINGFLLPNDSLLSAPFIDVDGNGDYTPEGGDYPHPENIDPSIIPSEMQWCVFNDLSPNPFTANDGAPLEFEFQLTSYAFSCEDNDILDHTVFTSYRIINRSENTYDSLRMGIFMDPDLGCYTDDYFGSAPTLNSFFSFNEDSVDGYLGSSCFGTETQIPTYGDHPPVQSTTFLNAPLTSFTYYNNGAIDGGIPGTTDPQYAIEYYNQMNSRFTDGTLMTSGGTGYLSGGDTVAWAFPGYPLDSSSWTMPSAGLNFGDRRMTGATNLTRMLPGDQVTIDMAHTFHLDTTLSREGNIARMYPRLDTLLAMYQNRLSETCSFPTEPCGSDCVWPGDANHDGRVNSVDYLTIIASMNANGSRRAGPLAWHPLPVDNWPESTFYGLNTKHCDADGNGVISRADNSIVGLHYGNTTPTITDIQEARFGDNFTLSTDRQEINANISIIPVTAFIKFTPQFTEEIQGMTFEILFDPYYVSPNTGVRPAFHSIFNDSTKLFLEYNTDSTVTYVDVLYNGSERPVAKDLVVFTRFNTRPELTDGRDTTYVEIRNAKALLPSGEIISIPGQRLPFIFVDSAPPIQVPISDQEEDITIYPNPTNGAFTLEVAEQHLGSKYSIVDIQGRGIEGGIINNIQNQLDLPAGVFIATVETLDGPVSKRIVVLN